VTIGHCLTPDFSITPLAGTRVSDHELERIPALDFSRGERVFQVLARCGGARCRQ